MKKLLILSCLLCAPAWAAQYVVPDADLTDTGIDSWTLCGLYDYQCIDNAPTPTDSEYAREDDGSYATFSGSSATDPGTDSGFRLCMRISNDTGNGTPYAQVRVYDHDDNLVHSTGNVEITSTSMYDSCEDISSAAEFDATDFAGGWYFYISMDSTGTKDCYMAEVWMEVPDAGGRSRRFF